MIRPTLPIAALLSALALLLRADDTGPKLRPLIDDRFEHDSRERYNANAAVRWEKGNLLLGPDASLALALQAGPTAEITAKLYFPALGKEGEEAVTRLGLMVAQVAVVGIEFQRKFADGKEVGEIRLIVVPQEGRQKHTTVKLREFPWAPRPAVEEWKIRYHYGLFEVSVGGQRVAIGHIDAGANPLTKFRWAQPLGRTECRALSLRAAEPPPPLTAEQQKELELASRDNDAAVRLSEEGKEREAKDLAQRAYETRKRVLGPRHHETLLSQVNLAAQLEHLGEHEQARSYYQDTLQTYRAILGNRHPDTAWVLNNLGSLLHARGDHAEARRHFEEALQIYQEVTGPRHPDTAGALNNLGGLLHEEGNLAGATRYYEQALSIRQEANGDKHPETAKVLNNLGSVLRDRGELAAARDNIEQALKVFTVAFGLKHRETANVLNNLAGVLDDQGDYTQARRLYEQALRVRQEVLGDKHALVAQSLNNMGSVLIALGEFAQGQEYLERALVAQKAAYGDRHPEVATMLNNLGHVLVRRGEYAAARPYFKQALALRKQTLGDQHRLTALSLNSLGTLYHALGDHAEARRYYEEALKIRKALLGDKHPDTATSLNNLGGLLHSTGDLAGARAYYEQALKIRREALGEKHPLTNQALANLANVMHELGERATARAYLEQALKNTREALGDRHPDTATALNNLAGLLRADGDARRAEAYYREALAIRRASLGDKHPNVANALNNLASVLQHRGEFKEARRLQEEALQIYRDKLGPDHPLVADVLNNLGTILEDLGEEAAAEECQKEALRIRRKTLGERHSATAQSLANLAFLCQSRGDDAAARKLLEEAFRTELTLAHDVLDTLSEAEALTYVQSMRALQEPLVSVLRGLPGVSPAEAYRPVWQMRALATRAVAGRRALPGDSPETRTLWERLCGIRKQLAELTLTTPAWDKVGAREQQLARLNEQKEEIERELAKVSAVYRQRRELQQADFAPLARLLRPGTALVDIVRLKVWERGLKRGGRVEAETHYEAFVVRPQADAPGYSVSWVHLGPDPAVNAAAARWRELLRSNVAPEKGEEPPQRTLRRLVWEHIEPALAGANAVVVIPDGGLAKVPWAALPGKQPGSYLIEEYAIKHAGHGQQLYELLSQEAPRGDTLLLVGGVQYDGPPADDTLVAQRGPVYGTGERPHWSYLAASRDEARHVAQLWGKPERLTLLEGPAAGKAAVREQLARARYVHLATHGFFADARFRSAFQHDVGREQLTAGGVRLSGHRSLVTERNPLILSGLVLAGANRPPRTNEWGAPEGDTGILTAEEVAGLDLRGTQLVVLSACETGLGDVAGGEGVFGLQRAFHMAGARTAVASLWHVDDQATQQLMTLFYQNLWRKKMGALEALRQAQLSILNGRTSPEGESRGLRKVERDVPPETKTRTPPQLWAAWMLSGDPGESSPLVASTSPPDGTTEEPAPLAGVTTPEPSSWPFYAALAALGVGLAVGSAWLVLRRMRGRHG